MRTLGCAVIGFGWMGNVHARAYSRVRQHYPDIQPVPELIAIADPDEARLEHAQARFGPVEVTRDWRTLLDDERIAAVSVTVPNFLHREIGVAVAEAGRHLWIEKPVGLTAAEAVAVRDAVTSSRVSGAVGFNYRCVPAVEYARSLVITGEIGRVTTARINLRADYAAHPQAALSWRFERARGGSGVIGDLVSHAVDLAHYLVGSISEVIADTAIVHTHRPIPTGAGTHYSTSNSDELGLVENDDYLGCLLRFTGGARGTIQASRTSVGDQCAYGFTISGTRGSVSWDYRRMGELEIVAGDGYLDAPRARLFVGPGKGEHGSFQPGAGNPLSYDDLKVIEARRFVASTLAADGAIASLDEGVAVAAVLDSLVQSAATNRWVSIQR